MTALLKVTPPMNTTTLAGGIAAALLLALANAASAAQGADEPALYANITVGHGVAVSGGNARVSLGGGVSAGASVGHDAGPAGSLAFGREFVSKKENGEPKHYRLEGELWAGSVKRTSITLDGTTFARRDAIDAQALFVNGLYRFYNNERYRGWLGLGLGWGRVSVPSAQDALQPCDCFGAKTASGLAYRLKLQVQRDLSENTRLFAELGYVRLPADSTGGLPSTRYGALGLTTIGLGLERRF